MTCTTNMANNPLPLAGLPSILMAQTISEILQISVILSDQSRELGYELAKSGYVQLFLGCLQSGAYMNTSSKVGS